MTAHEPPNPYAAPGSALADGPASEARPARAGGPSRLGAFAVALFSYPLAGAGFCLLGHRRRFAAGLATLADDAAVLEMAYGGDTPLAVASRARGARYADGLGMLVHQAAHAITLALGKAPPLPPLFEAVRGGA